jgi:hygromycin-B 7''-O-kinase
MGSYNMDLSQATSIVKKKYPKAEVVKITDDFDGQISKVYALHCKNPKHTFILKVYPDNFHWKLEKEVYVYKLIERLHLPTPKILAADDSHKILDRNYALMTKVEGKAVKGQTLSSATVEKIYFQMGKMLKKLHALHLKEFGYISKGITHPHKTNEEYMLFQFRKKIRQYKEFKGSPVTAQAISRYVMQHKMLLQSCKTPSLCHNDYHSGNILMKGTKVTGIIDVENMVSGDPMFDIAKTFYYDIRGDPRKEKAFLKGYGPLPNDWRGRVDMYKLYHALELWDWFVSIGKKELLEKIHVDMENFLKSPMNPSEN